MSSDVLPQKKGKCRKQVLAMLKGARTSFGVVLTPELEVLAILNWGGAKRFHHLKAGGGGGRARNLYIPCLGET